MVLRYDATGKTNWVNKVRTFLFRYDFGFAWTNQGVGDLTVFIRVLRQRLIDCHWQNWCDHVENSERFEMYNMFSACITMDLPIYLQIDLDRHIKFIMKKFRFGISDLYKHLFRYRNSDRIYSCPLCRGAEDNEIHFVLVCPVLENLRQNLIAPKFYRDPNTFRFTLLMSSRNQRTIRNLCIYLYKAFKIRERMIT